MPPEPPVWPQPIGWRVPPPKALGDYFQLRTFESVRKKGLVFFHIYPQSDSDYIESVLRGEILRLQRDQVEAKLLEALDSPVIEATPEFWAERSELRAPRRSCTPPRSPGTRARSRRTCKRSSW